MEVIRGFKVKLYPNKEQEKKLVAILDGTRFVWNYYLEQRKNYYLENKKTLKYTEMARNLTVLRKTNEVISGIQAEPLQQSLRKLDSSYNRFFRKVSRFPKFHSRHDSEQSFQKHQDWRILDNKIQIQADLVIKYRGNIDQSYKLGTLVVKRESTGKWFASVIGKKVVKTKTDFNEPIGIDVGIETLATLSNGEKYKNIRPQKTLQNKLSQAQRKLSRKQLGSNRRNIAKKEVANIYKKIKNVRENHLHNISRLIVDKKPSLIAVEDLNVTGMVKNHKLSKAITDASFRKLLTQLEYKQKWNGGEFIKINRFFPSSKTCNNCKHIVDSLPLSVRTWECPKCGIVHDRDINAAKMILTQAYCERGDSERVSARKESPVSKKRKYTNV